MSNEIPCIYYVGKLSKSRGQVLRVAVIFHTLFEIFSDDENSNNPNDNERTDMDNGDSDTNEDNTENANGEDNSEDNDNVKIDEEDIQAAINFVKTSIQLTLYMCGRGQLSDEVQYAGEKSSICTIWYLYNIPVSPF